MNAGKAGRGKKKIISGGLGGPEHIVKEWDRVVKNLVVSSRESQAERLIDGTESSWQSAGSQGKVRQSSSVMISRAANNFFCLEGSNMSYQVSILVGQTRNVVA